MSVFWGCSALLVVSNKTSSRTRRRAASRQQPYTRSYTCDSQGRLYQQATTINVTASYTETIAYDAYGRVKASQDASGYSMAPRYTARGFVDLQRDNRVSGASVNPDNTWRTIYEAQTMTARGQVASDRREDSNALASASVYDVRNGRLSRVCAGKRGRL